MVLLAELEPKRSRPVVVFQWEVMYEVVNQDFGSNGDFAADRRWLCAGRFEIRSGRGAVSAIHVEGCIRQMGGLGNRPDECRLRKDEREVRTRGGRLGRH